MSSALRVFQLEQSLLHDGGAFLILLVLDCQHASVIDSQSALQLFQRRADIGRQAEKGQQALYSKSPFLPPIFCL